MTAPAISRLLRPLSELQTQLLTVATLVYLTGYATWSYYAFSRGLGSLPPLDGQYFVAGLFPFLILSLLLTLVRQFLRITLKRAAPPTRDQVARAQLLGILGGLLAIATFIGLGLRVISQAVSFAALLIATLLLLWSTAREVDAGERVMARVLGWFLAVMAGACAILAIAVYAKYAFPLLPTEFGGPRAQCITLDIPIADLSPSTQQLLLLLPPDSSYGPAHRSKGVWLLFETDADLVLAATAQAETAPFRLSKDRVTGRFPSSSCH